MEARVVDRQVRFYKRTWQEVNGQGSKKVLNIKCQDASDMLLGILTLLYMPLLQSCRWQTMMKRK
jgi:hypothetical protein